MPGMISVYDPPMCCATGICGPSVDPELVRFAADLDWLAQHGVNVSRYNLSQQPAAFAENQLVRGALQEQGEHALPLVVVDGTVRSSGRYPGRDELGLWLGMRAAAADPSASGSCCGDRC
ncbi:MAG: arsenite efflux transporter metallochaperone ArsD [Armatimonadetes bacterium]|nr:arsenite efflux transporter metallochaperone ArsD [Armatimonadota bacterium]